MLKARVQGPCLLVRRTESRLPSASVYSALIICLAMDLRGVVSCNFETLPRFLAKEITGELTTCRRFRTHTFQLEPL